MTASLSIARAPTADCDGVTAAPDWLRCRLPFEHGPSAEVAVRYELAGPVGAPLVLIAGGISASRHVTSHDDDPSPGWWQAQAHTFRPYRRLAIDWVGSDGSLDRPIHPADQAGAMLLLLDHLGIARIEAFIGASYGAMIGMHLAALAPERCGKLLAISAAHRAHPFVTAQRALQRQAVELGERSGRPAEGVALARKLAMLSYRTREEFAGRFGGPSLGTDRLTCGAEPYLDAQGSRHAARTCAVAYRRLSESIDLHAIDPARIAVPATFAAALDDALIPAEDIAELAAAAPHGRFVPIATRFGHDSFLKEQALIHDLLRDFLGAAR